MDRLQFIGSIDQGDFVTSSDAIIQFFDHTMAAYDLLGQCNDVKVNANIESSISITFNISFSSANQTLKMLNKILSHHTSISIYGKMFNVTPSIKGNALLGIQIRQI